MATDSHSCAKPAGLRASFTARESPRRAAGGGRWLGKLISGTHLFLEKAPRSWWWYLAGGGESPDSGFCLGCRLVPADTHQGEVELPRLCGTTIQPRCFLCDSPEAADLTMPGWPFQLVMQEPQAGGCWGIPAGLQDDLCPWGQDWAGPAQPPQNRGAPGNPGGSRASGAAQRLGMGWLGPALAVEQSLHLAEF